MISKTAIRLFFLGVLFGSGISLSAQEPVNFVLVLLDDVGAGWIAPYADRLAPDDLEASVVDFYSETTQAPVDLNRHLNAARQAMPTLSRLAKSGVVFDRAFSTGSLCAPARAGLITGTFQQRWQVYDNGDIEDVTGLTDEFPSLAVPLQQAGYACGMIGKWHIGRKDSSLNSLESADDSNAAKQSEGESLTKRKQFGGKRAIEQGYKGSCVAEDDPLHNGFDTYFGYNNHAGAYYECSFLWDNNGLVPQRPKGEYLTNLFNEKALSFVEGALEEEKPFFLYYCPMSNHTPLVAPPEKYADRFDAGIQSSDDWAGHLLAVDEGLEAVVELLEERDQLENTVFVLTSDNGQPTELPPYNAPFRGGKGTGWMGGIHVPLVLSGGPIRRRGITTDLVSLADILPTFLDWAGLASPANIDGKSLRPFLTERVEQSPHKTLMSAGLHSSRWTHSAYFGERNKKDSSACPLYGVMIQEDQALMCVTETPPGLYKRYPEGIPTQTLLHDLKADPQQTRNASSSHPEKLRSMKTQLNDWLSTLLPPAENHVGQLEELKKLTDGE